MTPYCDVPDEDLIAYQEGDLGGARGEWVAAHAQVCDACRRRLAEFAEVDHILGDWDARTPVADDPAGRAALRARVEAELVRRARSPLWPLRRRLRRHWPRWPGRIWAALGLKALLIAGMVAGVLRAGPALGGGALWLLLGLGVFVVLVTAVLVVQLATLCHRSD